MFDPVVLKQVVRIATLTVVLLVTGTGAQAQGSGDVRSTIATLSGFADRSTGTAGAAASAEFIFASLQGLGLAPQTHLFQVPIRRHSGASITVDQRTTALQPLLNNAITPQAIDGVLSGPLIYVGSGSTDELGGKAIEGALLLMDFNSGGNWLTAAALGARGIIFIDRLNTAANWFFQEKYELSPLQLPCFWIEEQQAREIFGAYDQAAGGLVSDTAELRARSAWRTVIEKNIYCLIEGVDPGLKDELLVIEAFYDSTVHVDGRSPGADEAISLAALLQLARQFADRPPARSILLLATSGHAQSLHGMREAVWSMREDAKRLDQMQQDLQGSLSRHRAMLDLLAELAVPPAEDEERDALLKAAIEPDLKFTIDRLSRELMGLRLKSSDETSRGQIKRLADRRFAFRRLSWATSFHDLPEDEQLLLTELLPAARQTLRDGLADLEARLSCLESARAFRRTVDDYTVAAMLSLHLSSHGHGIGGFDRGWLYQLRPRINRGGIFSPIADVFAAAAPRPVGTASYVDSLRPGGTQTWDSFFHDRPFLGGEISSLAGYIGVSLVTVGDGRSRWGTPWDTAEHIDWIFLEDQLSLLRQLVQSAATAPRLHGGRFPRKGFATVEGTSKLLLQGELFADYPATSTTLLSYQGIARLYTTVHHDGSFLYKGVADSKNVFDKLIIEGYRFADETGEAIWAIDKNETSKDNYRVKIRRSSMKTRLIMFGCRQTTIFDLLEPRNLNYMTKIYLYDGRRDASPQRYWYSRIDTRASNLSSIYLEPGSLLKLTLSDSVLTRKFILTNASEKKPLGRGYPVDTSAQIINTTYHAAGDAWRLLTPRIVNLESHGIYDERIGALKERGLTALAAATRNLEELSYTDFREAAAESLALAARVYSQVETVQKDVLFGVLFYIALFIPFAFCMERFLFGFANIYKRIVAFLVILITLIVIIYNVHPAFNLAYSPMVVILAFFILGLSMIVATIIYLRFEEEMTLLQRHASHLRSSEISRWKAFVAAFFLGVSNLRRRRLRTILTSSTLIILTFTIMSFTAVKSGRQENRLLFQANAPYHGLLLKKMGWRSMPSQAAAMITGSTRSLSNPAPRIWLEGASPTRPVQVPLQNGGRLTTLQGLVGLSPFEAGVTGIDRLLTSGRWFTENDHQAIILSDSSAEQLGLRPGEQGSVLLWGTPFQVIGTFPGEALDTAYDLDGEPLTPVFFPSGSGQDLSDTELEAIESGEDIASAYSRYTHVPAALTAFIPAGTLLAMGGSLKSVAVRPDDGSRLADIASQLVDRFSLVIFSGTDSGVWLFNVSDTLVYSGMPTIIIPLLISVLIVLNTMISSVYERKNEIAIYTSVGLAPSHVGFLFVAEAMALAVISVVLGYLVAQVSAALFASTPLWQGVTVNYSSLAGVAAMILVICVVLVSVIYPARVAARIAIPDVNRSFQMPAPVEDTITVSLPFLMNYQERESVGGFLHQYFLGHQDISHGSFSTGHIDLVSTCAETAAIRRAVATSADPCSFTCVHLQARIWLAPFDFGIMQRIDLVFAPAQDNPAFLEINMTIHRESGESGQWQRINKHFIHELRKQLLTWRSMEQQIHEQFSSEFRRLPIRGITP